MTIICTPDTGVPFPPKGTPDPELVQSTGAACNTIEALKEEGLEVTPNDTDLNVADQIVRSFAAAEDQQKQVPTTQTLSKISPAAVLLTRSILDEFSHAVVQQAVEIRHLVTNKLIIDSDNVDPRVRLRALELLGKISDVGLFTDRSEVVVTHQSSAELENRLREKLQRLMAIDGEATNVVEVGGQPIDLTEELGIAAHAA